MKTFLLGFVTGSMLAPAFVWLVVIPFSDAFDHTDPNRPWYR